MHKVLVLILGASLAYVTALVDFTCPTPSSSDEGVRDFCDRSVFNDVIMPVAETGYFFKGNMVAMRHANNTIARGYPMPANKVWPKLPSDIDAAFTFTTTAKTYFLKGSEYWRYSNFVLDEGFPRPISEGFAGVPDDINAATQWGKYIYFFKDNLYYRYDACQNNSFPAPITDFVGIPASGKLDGVYRHPTNGYAYFFKGDLYYNFVVAEMKVNPAYPYQSGWHLFTCRWA